MDQSLLQQEEQGDGELRFGMLETIREFGLECLDRSGEAALARQRHRDYFLGLAEAAEPEQHGAAQGEWLARLEREHDNLRAALAWCQAAEDGVEVGLRLVGALHQFWMVRGHLTEGREQLAGLLALPGAEAPTAARARALDGAGWLAAFQGDFGGARALWEESLAICRELGDQRVMYGLLYNLGRVAPSQGDQGTARARFEESLAICRELGFKEGICDALLGLAWVAHTQGHDETARALLDEAGAQDPGSRACIGRGHVLLEMKEYAPARSCYEEGLALRRAAGDTQGTAASLVEVGHVAWLQGEHGVTRSNALEALGLSQKLGDKEGLLIALESLGVAALAEGQKEHAAGLLGAVAALREALELPAAPWWRRPRERISEAVRAASLEQAFAAAWAEGRAMPLEQAVKYALAEPAGAPA